MKYGARKLLWMNLTSELSQVFEYNTMQFFSCLSFDRCGIVFIEKVSASVILKVAPHLVMSYARHTNSRGV